MRHGKPIDIVYPDQGEGEAGVFIVPNAVALIRGGPNPVGSDDHNLHAVNVATSRSSWKFDTGDKVRSTPLVANELVYVGTESGELLASAEWDEETRAVIEKDRADEYGHIARWKGFLGQPS